MTADTRYFIQALWEMDTEDYIAQLALVGFHMPRRTPK